MVTFARLAVSLVIGLLSLGGIAAKSPSLKEIIDAIPDVQVKGEVKALMDSRDMDGAESKMMEYILREADRLAPENESEKDEFENNVVEAMKIIHDTFNPKKDVAFEEEVTEEEEDVPEETIEDEPEITLDMIIQAIDTIEWEDLKEEAQAALEALDWEKLEEVLSMVIDRMLERQPDKANIAKKSLGALHRAIGKLKKEEEEEITEETEPEEIEEVEPEIDAKMMAEAIQKLPDDAAKAAIIESLKANDFAKAETDMLDAMAKMMYVGDNVRAQVHEGMVNLKAAAEQYAEEQEALAEEEKEEELQKALAAEKKEDELIETLETIKADQERIEELLKELDGKN